MGFVICRFYEGPLDGLERECPGVVAWQEWRLIWDWPAAMPELAAPKIVENWTELPHGPFIARYRMVEPGTMVFIGTMT